MNTSLLSQIIGPNTIIMLFVAFLIFGVAIFLKGFLSGNQTINGLKYSKKQLLTNNEFEFFNRLIKALPEYHVLTQVSMGAVLNVKDLKNPNNTFARNTFDRKIIDFVILDKKNNIVAIIELDDRTHDSEKDAKRDAMLHNAGYKTVRFHSKNKPDYKTIRESII